MKIKVNGKELEVSERISLATLVEKVSSDTSFMAVAVNGEVIPKAEWSALVLKEKDKVEIISVFQGG